MDENNPLDAVARLQHELYNVNPKFMGQEGVSMVEYITNGDCAVITFLGINIWNDNEDPRPWDEQRDYQPTIYRWCLQEIDRISLELNKMLNSHRIQTVPEIKDQRQS